MCLFAWCLVVAWCGASSACLLCCLLVKLNSQRVFSTALPQALAERRG